MVCGKLRTARSVGNWLQNLQWCPSGQPDYGIGEGEGSSYGLDQEQQSPTSLLPPPLLSPVGDAGLVSVSPDGPLDSGPGKRYPKETVG